MKRMKVVTLVAVCGTLALVTSGCDNSFQSQDPLGGNASGDNSYVAGLDAYATQAPVPGEDTADPFGSVNIDTTLQGSEDGNSVFDSLAADDPLPTPAYGRGYGRGYGYSGLYSGLGLNSGLGIGANVAAPVDPSLLSSTLPTTVGDPTLGALGLDTNASAGIDTSGLGIGSAIGSSPSLGTSDADSILQDLGTGDVSTGTGIDPSLAASSIGSPIGGIGDVGGVDPGIGAGIDTSGIDTTGIDTSGGGFDPSSITIQ